MTDTASVAAEVWLALGYAAFLAAASLTTHLWARRATLDAGAAWPHGEAARLQQAIAALLAAVAALVLAVVTVRHPELPDAALSGGGLAMLALSTATILRRRQKNGDRESGTGD